MSGSDLMSISGTGGMTHLSMLLTMEMYQRTKSGIFGKNNLSRHISDDAWRQAHYCLDAPEVLPAGGSCWCQIDDEQGIPEQITVSREATHD